MAHEEIIKIQLKDPKVENLRVLDEKVAEVVVKIEEKVENTASGNEPLAEPEEASEMSLHVSRCKICKRPVKDGRSVAGMGPVCAKRLLTWLEQPEIYQAAGFDRVPKIRDLIQNDGTYPIMVVKNIKDGKSMAIDIQKQDNDGRYLVVDLTQAIHSDDYKSMKESMKVYLDANEHVVMRVFKPKDDKESDEKSMARIDALLDGED
jgi:hypothetical protein